MRILFNFLIPTILKFQILPADILLCFIIFHHCMVNNHFYSNAFDRLHLFFSCHQMNYFTKSFSCSVLFPKCFIFQSEVTINSLHAFHRILFLFLNESGIHRYKVRLVTFYIHKLLSLQFLRVSRILLWEVRSICQHICL